MVSLAGAMWILSWSWEAGPGELVLVELVSYIECGGKGAAARIDSGPLIYMRLCRGQQSDARWGINSSCYLGLRAPLGIGIAFSHLHSKAVSFTIHGHFDFEEVAFCSSDPPVVPFRGCHPVLENEYCIFSVWYGCLPAFCCKTGAMVYYFLHWVYI